MFSLENYFNNLIEKDLIEGSWLWLGLDQEAKLDLALQLAERISDNSNIFIISKPMALSGVVQEKVRNFPPAISTVREAIQFLNFTSATKKVLIVNLVEDLEFEAQNALLKTVEEPPAGSVLILLSSDADRVLTTLVSRTKTLSIPLVNQRRYFKKALLPEALDFFTDPKKNFKSLQNILGRTPEKQLLLAENLVMLLRDQVLDSVGLAELKISEIRGQGSLDNLKMSLRVLKLLRNYNVNPRLQLENLIFSILP